MRFTIFAFAQLLASARIALTQSDPTDASLTAWRAYGTFVKQYMTAGQSLTPGLDYLFVLPPTEYGIRGGAPVPEAVTNWDLIQRGDIMQTPDSPLFEVTGPSYVDKLRTYLMSAKTAIPMLNDTQQAQMEALTEAFFTAWAKYETERDAATAKWSADTVAQAAGTPLDIWANKNAKLYLYYRDQLTNAQARLDAYDRQVNGADTRLINEKLYNLSPDKALNEGVSIPGYNMPVYPGSFTPILDPWPSAPVEKTTGLIYRPLYTLDGFDAACDRWFKDAQAGNTILKLNLKDSKKDDWSDLGFTTSVTKGKAGLFGIIGAKAGTTKEVTEYNSWTTDFRNEVEITLSMKGAPLIFNVGAGFWDVPDVRTAYPKLLPDTDDPLANKIRTQKLLIGYNLSLNMTFTNSQTWKGISQFIETTRKDATAGLRIFGFSFGVGAGSGYTRNITEVHTTTKDNGSGTIYIPPTEPGMTFVLGIQGRKL